MLLIGSRAVEYWYDHKVPENADWDVICFPSEASEILNKQVDETQFSWKFGNVELHNANFFLNFVFEKAYLEECGVLYLPKLGHVNVCPPRALAVIKRSHLYRSLGITKHIIQYQLLDRNFDDFDKALIKARNLETKKYYPDEAQGFRNKSNEEFFVNGVKVVFKHDDLHDNIVDHPIYPSLKVDQSKAAYDDNLWINAKHEVKIQAIKEECYVIALERWLIPKKIEGIKYPYKIAYYKALEKACTTLDNGLLREYATDNWDEVRNFDPKVFDRFFNSELWKNYANK